MIDVKLPLELEDGTPVIFLQSSYDDIDVDIPSMPYTQHKHTRRIFMLDGTHRYANDPEGIKIKLRNKLMIDVTKPIETVDGVPVEYAGPSISKPNWINVRVNSSVRMYNPVTGEHIYNEQPNIRNTAMVKLIDSKKPVTVSGREAKIIHVFDNGNLAVVVDGWGEVQTYNQFGQAVGNPGVIVLVNKVEITERFVNVYPKNETVVTHSTDQAALNAYNKCVSSYDKFRVKQIMHDGVVVSTEVI